MNNLDLEEKHAMTALPSIVRSADEESIHQCNDATGPAVQVLFSDIKMDDTSYQVRHAIDEEVIADYLERMREGDRFPAIHLFFDRTSYWIADRMAPALRGAQKRAACRYGHRS